MSLIAKQQKEKSPDVHLIIASGGNAGYAAACAAKAVGLRCTVFLPAGLSPRFLADLKETGAEIIVGGKDYSGALAKAQEAVVMDEKRYGFVYRLADRILNCSQLYDICIWYRILSSTAREFVDPECSR
jgi:threonine dehydratase